MVYKLTENNIKHLEILLSELGTRSERFQDGLVVNGLPIHYSEALRINFGETCGDTEFSRYVKSQKSKSTDVENT